MRLSRMLRKPDVPAADESVPLRRLLFWALVAVAISTGVALYFRFEPSLAPLLG